MTDLQLGCLSEPETFDLVSLACRPAEDTTNSRGSSPR